MECEVFPDQPYQWLNKWMPQVDNNTLKIFAMLNHHYLREDYKDSTVDEPLRNGDKVTNLYLLYHTNNCLILEKLVAFVQGPIHVDSNMELNESEVILLPFNPSNTWQRGQVVRIIDGEPDSSTSAMFRVEIGAQFRLMINNKLAGVQYTLSEGGTMLVHARKVRLIGQRGTCVTCIEMKTDTPLTVIELTRGLASLTFEQDDFAIEAQPGDEIVFSIRYNATPSITQPTEPIPLIKTRYIKVVSNPPTSPEVCKYVENTNEPISEIVELVEETACIKQSEPIKECEQPKMEQIKEHTTVPEPLILTCAIMEKESQIKEEQSNKQDTESQKVDDKVTKVAMQEEAQMRRVENMDELRDIVLKSKPVVVCKIIMKSNIKQHSATQSITRSLSKNRSKTRVSSKKRIEENSDSSDESIRSFSGQSKRYRRLDSLKNDAIHNMHNSSRYLKVGSKFVNEYKYRYRKDHNVRTKFRRYYRKLREQLYKTINLMESYFGEVCGEYNDDKEFFYDKMEEITKLIRSPDFKTFPKKARLIHRHLHDIARLLFK